MILLFREKQTHKTKILITTQNKDVIVIYNTVFVTNDYVTFSHITYHVIRVGLLSQSASEKHNQEKKPTNLYAPYEFFKKTILLF